jgi:hypothetical protein
MDYHRIGDRRRKRNAISKKSILPGFTQMTRGGHAF